MSNGSLNNQEDPGYAPYFQGFFTGVIICTALGVVILSLLARSHRNFQQEAINLGYGHWDVDTNTLLVSFEWDVPTNQIPQETPKY